MPYLRLFPLNLVAFPGEEINLHIFEPRYKQLVQECLAEGSPFGLVVFLDDMTPAGTEMQVLRVDKTYENGEMDIVVKGLQAFHVKEFFPQQQGKSYPAGEVEYLVDNPSEDPTIHTKISDLFAQLVQLVSPEKPLSAKENPLYSFKIGHHIALSTEQEYELLCLASESERQHFILRHLTAILPMLYEVENLRERIQLNGHFRRVTAPEL